MDLITLDFETYYGDGYTLNSMTTEAYVRDPRFEALVLGVKINNDPVVAYVGEFAIREALDPLTSELDLENSAVLCHNALFDGFILSHHYGRAPKVWFDTLAMARAAVGSVSAKGLSLGAISEHFGTGTKGNEVVNARNKRYHDFTQAEMNAYVGYCAYNKDSDVNLTYRNFQRMLPEFTKKELQLIDVTTRFFTEPLLEFDVSLLAQYKQAVVENKARLIAAAGVTREELMSNNKFADVLRRFGVDPPMKPSPTRKDENGVPIETYAFAKGDDGMKELLDHDDEMIVTLAEARVGVKTSIAETRAQRYMDMGPRGRVPIYLKYWGAEQTGRHSAGDKTNFLNLGRTQFLAPGDTDQGNFIVTPAGMGQVAKVSKDGKRVLTTVGEAQIKDCHRIGLRDSMYAPEGYVIVVGDSSNIEARMVCYLADQTDVLDLYRAGGDPYLLMASELFQKELNKVEHVLERHLGKIMVLSLGFGAGEDKFLGIVRGWNFGPDAERMRPILENETLLRGAVNVFRRKYYRVKELWNHQRDATIPALAGLESVYADMRNLTHTRNGTIVLPNNRCLRYPNLRQVRSPKGEKSWGVDWKFDVREGRRLVPTKIYGGKMVENETQAMARVVVMDQLCAISRKYRVVLGVYDEVVCCVPKEQAEECEAYMKVCLSTPPDWAPDFPVGASTGVGAFYGACK